MARYLRLLVLIAVGIVSGREAVALDIKPYSVTFSVANIEKSAGWYQDILGFRQTSSKDYPEFKTRLIFLERDGFRIELISDGNAKPGVKRPDPPAHTAFLGPSQVA